MQNAFFVEVHYSPCHKRNKNHLLVLWQVFVGVGLGFVQKIVRGDGPIEVNCANQENECGNVIENR